MTRIIPAAVVAALVSLATTTAYGEPIPSCCACVPASGGQTSGIVHASGIPAYFCSLGMTGEAETRCGGHQPPAELLCLLHVEGDTGDGSSCREDLAAKGILCPAAGVPTAGARGLALLGLALTGVGAALLRRRASGRHG